MIGGSLPAALASRKARDRAFRQAGEQVSASARLATNLKPQAAQVGL